MVNIICICGFLAANFENDFDDIKLSNSPPPPPRTVSKRQAGIYQIFILMLMVNIYLVLILI